MDSWSEDSGRGYSTISTLLCGESLGTETVEVRTVEDIRRAVKSFGDRMAAANPAASFIVSEVLGRKDRAPAGYRALQGWQLGTQAWVKAKPAKVAA